MWNLNGMFLSNWISIFDFNFILFYCVLFDFVYEMKNFHNAFTEMREHPSENNNLPRARVRKEILVNVIQCLQILLEETTEELETSLINTAARIRELDPDDERDHGLLWGFRDNIQAIWEDSAVQVTNNRLLNKLYCTCVCVRHNIQSNPTLQWTYLYLRTKKGCLLFTYHD